METKAAPDGSPWQEWSEDYAKTLESHQSLLVANSKEGAQLWDSLTHQVIGDEAVLVGTNVIYAATHQFGDESRGIPARPFLGIDEIDLAQIIDGYFEELLA